MKIKARTRTIFPPHFLHQLLQLSRPVTRMIRAVGNDRLLALFAPYVVAVTLGTRNSKHFCVVFTIHKCKALAAIESMSCLIRMKKHSEMNGRTCGSEPVR